MQNAELTKDIPRPTEMDAKPRCNLCGSSTKPVLRGLFDTRFGTPGSYEIRRCERCGGEQTRPVPSPAELKKLYEEQYNFGGETGALYARLREWFLKSFLYRLWMRLDGDISFHLRRGSGRLLDIGCNEGRGLGLYARNGFEVEGLEINDNAAGVARSAGFEVHACSLDEFHPANSYDVAVLSNVLEHSLDPRQMLLEVNRILAPGGQVWISCPNSRSLLRRLFGRAWINWHVPFHISHFSAETLQRLLEETGFRIVETRQITPGLWVAESLIAWLFAGKGTKNRQLRNSLLTLLLMQLARFVFFPVWWLENQSGRGDCLLAVARKV